MARRYYARQEIVTLISIRPELLSEIEAEGLVTAEEEGFSPEALERLRVIRNLVQDLDVNLAGAEVILQMREEMRVMHELFEQVVRELVARMPP